MGHRSVVLSAAVMAVAVGWQSAATDDRPTIVRTTFSVEGMHCAGCQATIVGTLQRIDGVRSASADFEKGVAEAVHDARRAPPADLQAAIDKLGYRVTGMTTVAEPSADPPS